MKNKLRIAILGSNSFLAKAFSRFCLDGEFELIGYSRANSNPYLTEHRQFNLPNISVEFKDLLEFDCVIYAAGAGIQSGDKTSIRNLYSLNSFFPIQLLNELNALNYVGKVITFGSYFEIGYNNDKKYFEELDVVNSHYAVPNHYCSSKRLLTRYLSNDVNNLEYYHLILPNIYGVNENTNRLIPYLIRTIKEEKKISLTSGLQIRQYVHINDVVRLIGVILEQEEKKSGIYNCTNEKAIQVKEIFNLVFDFLNKDLRAEYLGSESKYDTSMKYLLLSGSKVKKYFNFESNIDLKEGIQEYLSKEI
ncbi:MAG: NAD(P)-dependent oxidoreductase [Bacteroidota bacterium]